MAEDFDLGGIRCLSIIVNVFNYSLEARIDQHFQS